MATTITGNTIDVNTAVLNRLSTDGTIVDFQKDGTSVGSIGTKAGELTIGSADTALRFTDAADRIDPWSVTSNGVRDATIDFGTNDRRFKDLYLSGGVYLGGTGAANKLDDYEEGTWTPAYTVGSSGYSNQVGKYTKIGEQVTAYFYLQMNNNQVGGSTLHVGGLPFTCNSNSSYGAASGIHCNSWSTSAKKPDNGLVAPNNTVIDLYHSQGTTATTQPVGNDIGNGSLIGCVVYRTSS